MMQNNILQAERLIPVRFNEVDSMSIVWHGVYIAYFEAAREAFGDKYNIGYKMIHDLGYYTPLVSLNVRYRSPLTYGDTARIIVSFNNTESAKILFDYEIHNADTGLLAVTGNTVQVFTDIVNQKLVWNLPEFFKNWKKEYGLL